MIGSVLRYWNTVRHLHSGQVTGRLRFRLLRPTLSRAATPRRRDGWAFVVRQARRHGSMVGPTQFRFLNVERECRSAGDWNDPAADKLWLYNLHYFADLVAVDADERVGWHVALISRWIDENPPRNGVGWDPYPTSLRIGNWIRWRAAGHTPPAGFDRSLALQARWLRRRIEHHLRGNHLLANAKALTLAGVYFDGAEAAGWRDCGLRLLEHELATQVLEDGGHSERSPMYHALVLEDLLDLINAAEGAPGVIPAATIDAWRDYASRMVGWLESVTHPDGEIALLNDAAFGIAPSPADLHAYADRLGIRSAGGALAGVSGYVRAERGAAVLIVDVAAVGPDEQPGHAHADTLTFELSLHRNRVIVDTGTSTYVPGPQRAFERSTAAHNTVEIDGRDSSEVWSSFRVARRARPRDVSVTELDGLLEIRGAHDGYARLGGQPIHSRVWRLRETRLTIADRISADGLGSVGRILLHPSVTPAGEGVLRLADGRECRWHVTGASASIQPACWHPEFGVSRSTHCVVYTFAGSEASIEFEWDGR